MHPILVKLGPLTVYTYGVFAATGLLLGVSLALRQGKQEGYDPQVLLDFFFYVILAGIAGSRVFYVLQHFSSYRSNPLNIFKLWEGGLVFYGGLLFAFPLAWFLLRRQHLPFWESFDLIAPSLAIGQAFGRIGCFFAGCCYGLPSQVPWAVTFTDPDSLAPRGIPLHPTQLYHALAGFVVFFALVLLRRHRRFTGQVACLYLILHSVLRFVVEDFRGDARAWIVDQALSLTQVISVVIFLLGIVLYFSFRNHREFDAT